MSGWESKGGSQFVYSLVVRTNWAQIFQSLKMIAGDKVHPGNCFSQTCSGSRLSARWHAVSVPPPPRQGTAG